MKSENASIFVGFAPIFLDCFALVVALCGLSCCGFAPVVCGFLLGCGLCCWWFFFPSDGMIKRKGKLLGLVLSSWVVVIRLLYV